MSRSRNNRVRTSGFFDTDGNGARDHGMEARVSVMSQRVATIEEGFSEIRREMSQHQMEINQALSSISSEFKQALGGIQSQLLERAKPQYGLLISLAAFLLSFSTAIGFMAYTPIKGDIADLKVVQSSLLPRAEYEPRHVRLEKDINTLFDTAEANRGRIVSRSEIEQRWAANQSNFANLQRQIDEVKNNVSGIYPLREVIGQIIERQNKIEDRRVTIPPSTGE